MTPLRATYRMQLTAEFGFAAARELVPYLASLGVSHLYLSPILQARSTHGYDVTDPARISAELGGEDQFRALAAACAEAGLGLILDVVPNHMGAFAENRYWSTPELRDHFFDVDPVSQRWRRFFDIDDLAAVRVELPEVFEATHGKILSLVSEGLVDGLRVDHPDGLADPEAYLKRLADAGVSRVWVEKILGPDEALPSEWPVSGTVGYDFLNDLVGLFVCGGAEPAFTSLWESVSGDPRPFGAWAFEAKLQQALGPFRPELERLGRAAPQGLGDLYPHLYPHMYPQNGEVASALAQVLPGLALALASLPVYRTYIGPSAGEFLTRFQQTSPAIMAKGVEDTAFYRYGRLLALNEVGSEPARWTLSIDGFHARNAVRAARYPEGLLTTMTHDAKRSADVRARLVALTWFPQEWSALVERWLGFEPAGPAGAPGGAGPDRIERYFVLQTLLGVHPFDPERLDAYLEKALREAKRNSNWIEPDLEHEAAVQRWARALLDVADFRGELEDLLAQVGPLAEQIHLGWIALKLTSPGVPDLYQGDELAFTAVVDPDNRRPVDFATRRATLERVLAGGPAGGPGVGGREPVPGHRKLALIHDLLALRARRPEAFGPGASYVPVDAGSDTISFIRGRAVQVDVALRAVPRGQEVVVRELN